MKGQVTKWENERMYLWHKALDPVYYKGLLQIKKRKRKRKGKMCKDLEQAFLKGVMRLMNFQPLEDTTVYSEWSDLN